MKQDLTKLSRFISLILRHKPETINIKLDNYGYAKVDELIKGINETGHYYLDLNILKTIVKFDEKQRYSFNTNYKYIRANQGHSIPVELGLKDVKPPKYLYHGTAFKYVDSIMSKGILKGSRNHVHLSEDIETAIKVGERHGEVRVFKIDTESMDRDGIKFYLSENKVWLTDYIDNKYISLEEV